MAQTGLQVTVLLDPVGRGPSRACGRSSQPPRRRRGIQVLWRASAISDRPPPRLSLGASPGHRGRV